MSRRILSVGFIVFLFSLTGFGANGAFNSGNASNRNFDVNTPPAFSSTPPTASHPFGSLFTYDFSATDNDADEISFKVLGNEQVDANYQDSYNWATGYGPTRWQSFTAISSGILTKAGVLLSDQNTETVTVNIYNGSGNGGLLLYTTSLNMYNMADYWEISIPLSANVIVQTGQQYTIEYVSGSSGLNGYMKGDGSGPLNYYNDGSCDFSFYNTDYSFRVNIKPFTATPTVSWLNLTDNSDGTGSISGTPPPEAAGNFTFDIYAHSFTHYVKQTISFTIYDPTPSVPTGIYGVAGNGSVNLKWNKHSNNEVSKYYIYRGTEADPTELIDSTSSASDTTKLFTGLTNLTQYFFRVKAVSESGLISGYSANESVTPVDGFGNAIELNGSYQYVTIPGITELTGNSFTLETWVKRYSANSYQIIFGQGNINTSYGLHVGFRYNNVFTAAFYADDIDTQDQYPELTWVHWAFTYDSETNEKKIYRNGVEVGSGISSEDFLGSGDLYIGMSPWYDNFFHGQLDEARVWNYVRTESDVSENRITPLTGEESGLIALYHFDEISGSTVYDATKNGRNGTIVNGAYFVASLVEAPQTPTAFDAQLISNQIELSWMADTTGTFSHFSIFRSLTNQFNEAILLSDTITVLNYTDVDFPEGDLTAYYWISAFNDKNMESEKSQTDITIIDNILRKEKFDGLFPPVGWTISNPDNARTWDLYELDGGGGGEALLPNLVIDNGRAAFVNFYSYSSEGQIDVLKTKPFLVHEHDYLKFDVFYRGYDNTYEDALNVLISTDGGETFNDVLYDKTTYTGLRTMPGYDSDYSTPLKAENWRTEGIDLSAYDGEEIIVAFQSINGYGNDLYIDNVESSSTLPRPARLYAKGIDGGIELHWTSVPSNNFMQYNIYSGPSYGELAKVGQTTGNNASDTSFTITSLTNGSEYVIVVDAENLNEEKSEYSPSRHAIPMAGFGNALSLDGADDFVNMYDLITIANTSFTLEAWVKRYPNGNNQYIFGDGTSINVNQALHVGFNPDNYFLNNFYNNDLVTETAFTDTLWHHWAVTYDQNSNNRSTYLDGVEISAGVSNGDFDAENDFLVGAAFGGQQTLFGFIDEVRVWDYARSESEISNNRNIQLIGSESGLMGLWHFDENVEIGNALDAADGYFDGSLQNGAGYISAAGLDQAALPVELTSFTFSGNNLLWSTASETNNAGWEIESRIQESGDRSQNTGWKKIGFIAGKGTTTEKQTYSFSVLSSEFKGSSLQVRLKQIDTDGKFTYSNVLNVNLTPETYSLSQNYPNPFNPTTSISYQLKANSFVSLKVFDLLGREVKTLINEVKSAGSYSLNFSAVDLPSGVYFYKLTAGSFTQTKKMTVMK